MSHRLIRKLRNTALMGSMICGLALHGFSQCPMDQVVSIQGTEACEQGITNINLSKSEVGVSYVLRNDADNSVLAGPLNGNGGGLSFSTGILNATTTFNILASGFGCDQELSTLVTYTVHPVPVVSTNLVDTTICLGDSLFFQASGADSYFWNNGVTDGSMFKIAAGGKYRVIGTDVNGCVSADSVNISVVVPSFVKASADKTTICQGEEVLFDASGATSYQWNPSTVTNGASIMFDSVGNFEYEVTGTDDNGCQGTSQVVIHVNSTPSTPGLPATEFNYCKGDEFENITATSDGTGHVHWYGNADRTDLLSLNGTCLPEDVNITEDYYVVLVEGACAGEQVRVVVNVNDLPEVEAGTDKFYDAGSSVQLNGLADNVDSVFWSPAEVVDNPNINNPMASALETTELIFTGKSADGCYSSDTLILKQNITISNFLSPNNDGNNDTWQIHPLSSLQGCKVQVFDGLGAEIYSTSDYQNEWGGEFNGAPLPDGAYYYVVECEGFESAGTITILR